MSACFPFLQLRIRWWLTSLIGITFLIAAIPQHANAFYDYYCVGCTHVASPSGVNISEYAPDKVEPRCVDLKTYSNRSDYRKTCPSGTDQVCMKMYAVVQGLFEVVQILIRDCVFPTPEQMQAISNLPISYHSCYDFKGTTSSPEFKITVDVEFPQTKRLTETLQVLSKGAESKAAGKQNGVAQVTGSYCLCSGDYECNGQPGMGVSNPDKGPPNFSTFPTTPTTTTTTATSRIQKALPQLIFFTWILDLGVICIF